MIQIRITIRVQVGTRMNRLLIATRVLEGTTSPTTVPIKIIPLDPGGILAIMAITTLTIVPTRITLLGLGGIAVIMAITSPTTVPIKIILLDPGGTAAAMATTTLTIVQTKITLLDPNGVTAAMAIHQPILLVKRSNLLAGTITIRIPMTTPITQVGIPIITSRTTRTTSLIIRNGEVTVSRMRTVTATGMRHPAAARPIIRALVGIIQLAMAIRIGAIATVEDMANRTTLVRAGTPTATMAGETISRITLARAGILEVTMAEEAVNQITLAQVGAPMATMAEETISRALRPGKTTGTTNRATRAGKITATETSRAARTGRIITTETTSQTTVQTGQTTRAAINLTIVLPMMTISGECQRIPLLGETCQQLRVTATRTLIPITLAITMALGMEGLLEAVERVE